MYAKGQAILNTAPGYTAAQEIKKGKDAAGSKTKSKHKSGVKENTPLPVPV